MLQQGLELFVGLRECVGLLAISGALLRWRFNTQRYKQVSKLWVAHQSVFVKAVQQIFLAALLLDQVNFQHLLVQLQHWLGEHAHSQVNQA